MHVRFPRTSFLTIFVLAMGLGVSSAGWAQADDADLGGIDEIVVTAQKRDSTLQETAISLSVLTGDDIEAKGITDAIDLTQFIPNVNIQINAEGTGYFVSIRAISQADSNLITRDQPTAVYVDGVWWGRGAGNLADILEMERVEVLRGPQGDLYGRNSSAGAINFISRKPSGEWGTKIKGTYGNYDRSDLRIYQEFPIFGEDRESGFGVMSGSLSFATINRDGFYENTAGNDLEEEDRIAARGALNWKVGDLTADLSVDYTDSEEQGGQQLLTAVWPHSGSFGCFNPLFAAANPFSCLDPHHSPDTSGVNIIGALGAPLLEPLVNEEEPFRVDVGGCTGLIQSDGSTCEFKNDEKEIFGVGLTLAYDFELGGLGPVTLKSISGYRSVEVTNYIDRDGTALNFFESFGTSDFWWYTQEFNLIGSTETSFGKVDWVFGAFLLHEEGDQGDGNGWTLGSVFGNSAADDVNRSSVENTAWALFGNVAWTPPVLDDRLILEFGLRQTFEDKQFERKSEEFPFLGGDPILTTIDTRENFRRLTPAVRVHFRATEDINLYASYSQGFTAGGFNGRAANQAALDTGYDEEDIDSYEVGIKAMSLDGRLRTNVSVFWMIYKDMQRTALAFNAATNAVSSVVVNAGRAEVKGVEAEVLLLPFEGMTLSASYGLTDAEYKKYLDFDSSLAARTSCSSFTNPANPLDCPGFERDFADEREFSNAPENNVTLGMDYVFPSFEFGTLVFHADYYWQDETCIQNCDQRIASDDEYDIVNARLTLRDVSIPGVAGGFDISIFGKNLTDEEYRPFGIDFETNTVGVFPWLVQNFGPPRTYGVEVTWRFGSMND